MISTVDKIAQFTIMDLVRRGKLPNNPGIAKWTRHSGILPTVDALRDSDSVISMHKAAQAADKELDLAQK